MNKIFILGLPRTGTTSVCSALLDRGFKVAHTAYTQQSIELSDVIADTPVYCDYPFLDSYYPKSKFIYLDRNLKFWAPSMQDLLSKIRKKMISKTRGYHPLLERCLLDVFGSDVLSTEGQGLGHLKHAYLKHKQAVIAYFKDRSEDCLFVDMSSRDSYSKVCRFIGVDDVEALFPMLNTKGHVFAWNNIQHPLKISSHERGKFGLNYFDLEVEPSS